jgi:hypothetical protein
MGIDFRTAATVCLDPYVIEFDDLNEVGVCDSKDHDM